MSSGRDDFMGQYSLLDALKNAYGDIIATHDDEHWPLSEKHCCNVCLNLLPLMHIAIDLETKKLRDNIQDSLTGAR